MSQYFPLIRSVKMSLFSFSAAGEMRAIANQKRPRAKFPLSSYAWQWK